MEDYVVEWPPIERESHFSVAVRSEAYNYITNNIQAKMAIDILRKEKILCVDTETTGLDPHVDSIHLLQIGNPRLPFVVDANRVDLRLFKGILEDPSILHVLQNAVFDYKFLKKHYGIEIANIYDTMLAELTISCGLVPDEGARRFASLANLCSKYLDVHFSKKIRLDFTEIQKGFDFSSRPDLLKYTADDVFYPAYIHQLQRKEIIKYKLGKCLTLEFKLIPVVAEMELLGVEVDLDLWESIIASNANLKNMSMDRITKLINSRRKNKTLWDDILGIDLDSPKQLLGVLKESGFKDLDGVGYTALLPHVGDPLIDEILKYKGYAKFVDSFGSGLKKRVNPVTGRMHTSFNQLGAAQTGRFSSSGNCNLQQIPTATYELINGSKVKFRDCFKAGKGKKFVAADYSQQEVRIAAFLFQANSLKKSYSENKDVYKTVGSMMFQREYEEVTPEQRQIAKMIVLGTNYGGGPDVIQRGCMEAGIKMTLKGAMDLLSKYQKAMKDMFREMSVFIAECIRKKYVGLGYDKKRFLFDFFEHMEKHEEDSQEYRGLLGQMKRRIRNSSVQGRAALMIKIALLDIWERCRAQGLKASPCLVVHDEIVLEADEADAEEVAKIMEKSMDYAFLQMCPGFPNKVDVHISDKWEKS